MGAAQTPTTGATDGEAGRDLLSQDTIAMEETETTEEETVGIIIDPTTTTTCCLLSEDMDREITADREAGKESMVKGEDTNRTFRETTMATMGTMAEEVFFVIK